MFMKSVDWHIYVFCCPSLNTQFIEQAGSQNAERYREVKFTAQVEGRRTKQLALREHTHSQL